MNETADTRYRNEREGNDNKRDFKRKKKKKVREFLLTLCVTRLANKQKKKRELLNVLVDDCKEIITLVALGIN